MIVIPPIEITPAKLTACSVPEEVVATYSGGTTYAAGQRAGAAPVDGAAQVVWESLQDGNTDNAQVEGVWWTRVGIVYPIYNGSHSYGEGDIVTDLATHSLYLSIYAGHSGSPLTDTSKWERIGPTNRYLALTYTSNNRTVQGGTISYTITPGTRINALAIIGVSGASYSVSASSTAGGGVVFTDSGSLSGRETMTWSDYFFGAFESKESVVVFDIPPYSDIVVTVEIEQTTGSAEVVYIVVGKTIELGDTQQGAISEALNYSTIVRDEDGNATLTKRRSIPQTNQTVVAPREITERCRRARRDLNAVPAVWCGLADDDDEYFGILAIMGIYKDWTINAAHPRDLVQSITLEEI